MFFRFHEWQASLKHVYSLKENIPVSVFLFYIPNIPLLLQGKNKKILSLRCGLIQIKKKAYFKFFWKCRKMKIFTKIQQEIQK